MEKKLLKNIILFLSTLLICALPLAGCSNGDQTEGGTTTLPETYPSISQTDSNYFIKADGENLVDGNGDRVVLRGVNAGGLFVTEHWMTGFKYGEANDYKTLSQTFIERFGEEQTKQLWAEYRANWWTDVDFENCANMGINVIRLPFTYMNVDFAAITSLDDAGKNYDFSALDAFIERAAYYGIYTILDLHGAYGSQNGQDHSGEIVPAGQVDFYSNAREQQLTIKLWSALAEHYKNNSAVAGYDLLNEPAERLSSGTDVTSERHWNFYDKVYSAIRAVGDEHLIIFESCWDGANLPQPAIYGWQNCMYSFHHYATSSLSDSDHGVDWNKKIANITSQNFGVPLQMGEFTNYSSVGKWDYVLDLLNREGWSWCSWTYKVWGNMPWGIINIRGSSDEKVDAVNDSYDEIIAKFSKLRTDGDYAKKYTFASSEDGQTITLESLFKKYTTAPSINERVESFNGILCADEGWVTLSKIGTNALCVTSDYYSAKYIKLVYHSSNDGSAYLSTNSGYLSATTKDEKVVICATGSQSNSARFYPVINGDGFALVSYTACKYLRLGDDGIFYADAECIEDATTFTLD